MISNLQINECCGCESCFNICPQQAIKMEYKNGFLYPCIDNDKCIKCNLCDRVCPQQQKNKKIYTNQLGYVGRLKNKEDRFNSTSGGIAFALGKKIISENGKVYGVVFNKKFESIFSGVDTLNELYTLQGSKYPQATLNNCLKDLKTQLKTGKIILFIGTPCQVAGVRSFLQKDYDNLFLVDIICHGVPSPKLWKNYINLKFKNETIHKVIFKHKENGWKKWQVFIETDKQCYKKSRANDEYMSSYLAAYNIRPSCFECIYKGQNRISDITIGDAWGTPENNQDLNDDSGLSAIIINNKKGEFLFDCIKSDIDYQSYSIADLTEGNIAYHKCIKRNIFSNIFWKKIKKDNVLDVLNLFSNNHIVGKVMWKLSNIVVERKFKWKK